MPKAEKCIARGAPMPRTGFEENDRRDTVFHCDKCGSGAIESAPAERTLLNR